MPIKTKKCIFPGVSEVKEILVPDNEPCDVWLKWEKVIKDFIISRINNTTNFLDIGANIGYFSLWAATRAMTVFAAEPNPSVFEILRLNSGLFKNIFPYNVAISDTVRTDKFYYRDYAHGDGRLYDPKEHNPGDGNVYTNKVIPVETLSSFQEKYCNGQPIDFIKMDCEGSEHEILKDIEFFRKSQNEKCEVMLELHGPMIEMRGYSYKQFLDYLESNFRIYDLSGSSYSVQDIPARGHIVLRKR